MLEALVRRLLLVVVTVGLVSVAGASDEPSAGAKGMAGAKGTFEFKPDDWMDGAEEGETPLVSVDVGAFNPLLGLSYRDIAAAMVGVTQGGTKCDTYASCQALIDDGEDIDYDGASGPGEWVSQGEPAAGTYDVWEFRDGLLVTLDIVEVG